MFTERSRRPGSSLVACALAAALLGASSALLGVCGPFTDAAADAFCPLILEILYLGITTGTTPTTFDPTANVSRIQMAAFLSRTVDGTLKRGSRRAALNQFWPTDANAALALTTVGVAPRPVVSDGEDVWVGNRTLGTVSRVHASDGRLLETWTGSTAAAGALSVLGRVFLTGFTNPGNLYRIDPSQPAGAVTIVSTALGNGPSGIAYDGSRIWTANAGNSVSIVTPGATTPWTVTTVTTGFGSAAGMAYDGANIWVANQSPGTVVKVDSAGAILQTVTVGAGALFLVFDGANLWVPNSSASTVSVVRASNGAVLGTLTGNGLDQPVSAAFDGQRILVTNFDAAADNVSLWKAADLTPLGSFSTGPGTRPYGACSDGIHFWITLSTSGHLSRF
jgi:hypothetical protein